MRTSRTAPGTLCHLPGTRSPKGRVWDQAVLVSSDLVRRKECRLHRLDFCLRRLELINCVGLRFEQPVEQRFFVNVDAVDAGHRVVEQQAGFDLVERNALGNGAVGVPQNVTGFAGQAPLAPNLRKSNGSEPNFQADCRPNGDYD